MQAQAWSGPAGLAVIDAATRFGARRAVATATGSWAARQPELRRARCVRHRQRARTRSRSRHDHVGGERRRVDRIRPVLSAPAARHAHSGVALTRRRRRGRLHHAGVQRSRRARHVGGGRDTVAAATSAERACAVLGIASGSAAWFAGMAYVSVRCQRAFRANACITSCSWSAALIVASGAVSLARAVL